MNDFGKKKKHTPTMYMLIYNSLYSLVEFGHQLHGKAVEQA